MSLMKLNTEKIPGRITHVYIGKSDSDGVDIQSGIISFEYARVHDARTAFNAASKTDDSIFQPHSNFTWRLEFLSDCYVAFFAKDVSDASGIQYAMTPNGDSNKIDYFKVVMPIESSGGASKTRTYTITNGYALRNGARIGDDEDAIYWYEGIAQSISYSDSG